MKNHKLLIGTIVCLLLLACCNNKQKTDSTKQEENKNYFPVADFIRGEISYVDSLPLGIIKYIIKNGKTDSSYIKTDEFDRLAQEFLPAELNDSIFRKNFIETSFLDQTTQLLTFTYSTKNALLQLHRVDILATPSATGFDKVRSIYMEKSSGKNDTSIIKKMYWRTKKSFEIITLLQPNNKPLITDQLKVVWDNDD